MVDTRFEDGRVQRRDLTGVWTGAAAGALVAIVVAVLIPIAGTAAATAVGIVLGAGAGAWLGRSVVRQVSADDGSCSPATDCTWARAPPTPNPERQLTPLGADSKFCSIAFTWPT